VKHSIAKIRFMDWHDVPTFFEALSRLVKEVWVVPGNHDGYLEALVSERVNILPVSGHTFDSEVGIIHGHAWPKPKILGCDNIIMGHLHPMITLIDALGFLTTHQVWLRTRSDGEALARGLLKHLQIRIGDNIRLTMKRRFDVILTNPRCIFLPSFNNLLGGQAVNRNLRNTHSRGPYSGPLLKSGGVNMKDSDVYLLDGSYLGKLNQLQQVP
jgi:metallophosphoesterase superfamily enzyme